MVACNEGEGLIGAKDITPIIESNILGAGGEVLHRRKDTFYRSLFACKPCVNTINCAERRIAIAGSFELTRKKG